MAHFPAVFSASSFAFLRKSISRVRPELGQLILMTSSFFGHLSDIASSTTVDLPTIAGSREMTLPNSTVKLSCGLSLRNSNRFPLCTTLLSTGIPESFTSSAFFLARVSRTPFCSNERQLKAMMMAMNLLSPLPSERFIAEDTRMTERLAW